MDIKQKLSLISKHVLDIAGKKEKSKKKPRDINKRGEMIQGTEFDAYVDDTPHTQVSFVYYFPLLNRLLILKKTGFFVQFGKWEK